MGKAVKKILFFLDFVVRYVRFWSRIFTYINAPLENRRHVSNGVHRERRERREPLDRITGFTEISFLPGGADLAAAFSIQASAKPAASVRRAIGDGRIRICRPAKKESY